LRIVVTDLTRMREGHICVAGIDLATGERVRPVRDRLGAELLRTNGGPFDVGAIVDLGSCRPVGSAPEVEDVLFQPSRCVHRGYVPPDEFYELCKSKSAADLSAIGPELKQFGRSLTTLEGKGDCSLVFVSSRIIPKVFINAYNKLRYDYGSRIELSVTDVRLYDRKLLEPDAKKVEQLQSRLAATRGRRSP